MVLIHATCKNVEIEIEKLFFIEVFSMKEIFVSKKVIASIE